MARRRRRSKGDEEVVAVLAFLILGGLGLRGLEEQGWVSWVTVAALLVVAVIYAWGFLMKTRCDVEKANGEGCRNPVQGALRACHLHRRDKWDALFALFGLVNPARRWRILWARQGPSHGRRSPQIDDPPPPRVIRPVYDGAMLAAAVISALVAVASLTFDLLG